MTQAFLKLLNMSICASWIVLAVLVLRPFLRKAPKWIVCILWSVVALRLILPFSLESGISLIPSPQVIPQDIIQTQTPAIQSGIPVVNSAVNPLFTGALSPEKNLLETFLSIATCVWLAGVGILVFYSLFTYLKLRWQVLRSIRYDKNVYICDEVDSPFILGTILPKIYIPSGMSQEQITYVLAHENAHLKRLDHWWKPLGFLLLTVYWFNPLLWVGYLLLCRDIEMACDEKVVADLDSAGKRGYSEALIACSVHRRMVMACPVAFGELSVKSRIKSVLRYKKPALWVALAALAVCVLVAGCFLTDPPECAHTYESKVVTEATCTDRGVEEFTCTQCQHVYTAYTDMIEHSYGESQVTLAPTCTATGSARQACTQCGKEMTVELAIIDHTPGEPYTVQEANCTEEGKRSATCTACAQVFVVEILAVNDVHDMKETVLRQPSCADPGEGVNTCTRCNHQETISYQTTAHNYKTIISFPATCTREGGEQKTCTVCGKSIWTASPATGEHNWKTVSGGNLQCSLCGDVRLSPRYSSGYSLFGSTVGNTTSTNPQLPSVVWDLH